MDNTRVQNVASSLVREFLSRKGLKSTLDVLDEELPRTGQSINNRNQLMRELHIDRLMKENKNQIFPFRTMLEVISKYFLDLTNGSSEFGSVAPHNTSLRDFPDRTSGLISSKNDYIMMKNRTETSKLSRGKDDLIIEDDVESETLLGDGKAGIFERQKTEEHSLVGNQSRPRSANQRGLSGPITSSKEDAGRRRYNKPQPLTSSTIPPHLNLSHGTRLEDSQGMLGHSSLSSKKALDNVNSQPRPSLVPSPVFDNAPSNNDKQTPKVKPKKSIHDIFSAEVNIFKPDEKSAENGTERTYSVDTSSIASERSRSRGSKSDNHPKKNVEVVDLGDVDDLDSELAALDLIPKSTISKLPKNMTNAKPIDAKCAIKLKSLLFGSGVECFNEEWRKQSFEFCDFLGLTYGIVQRKGGPCGVLASVQACLLQEMLFGDCKLPSSRKLDPSRDERSRCLATALAKIFWRAGNREQAVVTVPSGRSVFTAGNKYKPDKLTETLMLYTFVNFEELLSFIKLSITQFELEGSSGVVLALYSAVLSRTTDRVKCDMDEPSNRFMGAHCYCTQEMVNLFLTGRAVSNVFNDDMEVDAGTPHALLLKGIEGRNDVGLMSLFEHYQSCQVGTFYKTPVFPIWVVCSESHFSVLFSVKKELVSDWKVERRFDLYYYDGLARQLEEIRLTVETTNRHYQPPSEDDLVPPLELCIRTKWPEAEIEWNGTEPIL